MCLSTVYIKSGDQHVKVMQDVAQMVYKNEGYLLTGLLGNQKYVKGKVKRIDFVDDHTVVLEKENFIEFDLFNSQGFYLYRLIIPDYRITKPHSPRIIRGGFFYDIKEKETGDAYIRRYKIKNWDLIKEGI